MTSDTLQDLLNLKFTRRKLLGSEVRTKGAFHRLFYDQIYDLEAEERHLQRQIDLVVELKASLVTNGDR